MPVVKTNGIDLYYRERGDGAAVVFAHSLTLNHAMFDVAAQSLAANGYRTLQVDLRGHGASSQPDQPCTLDDLTQDILGFIDALRLRRLAWIGLSMGGMVGMRLALKRPALLSALVLLDTSAEPDPKRQEYEAWAEANRGKAPDAAYAQGIASMMLAKGTRAKNPVLVERVKQMALANTPEGLYHSTLAVLRRPDFRGQLREIRTPTLVVVGEHDGITPRPIAEALQQGIAGSELFVVPGAGHLSIMEQPELVIDRIEQFLGTHAKRGA